MTEQDIQNLIMIYVTALPRSFFWRANTGASMQDGRFTRYGIPGQADILGALYGRFVAIEVKTKTGRQSVSQKQWQVNFERGGGLYILARSVEDVKNVLKENGLVHGAS